MELDWIAGEPEFLTAEDVSRVLRISRSDAYALVRREGLALDLGMRLVRVPRARFKEWVESRLQRV